MIDTQSTGVVRRYGEEEEEVMLIYYGISAHYAIQVFDYLISLDPLSHELSSTGAGLSPGKEEPGEGSLGPGPRGEQSYLTQNSSHWCTQGQSSCVSHTHSVQHLPKDNSHKHPSAPRFSSSTPFMFSVHVCVRVRVLSKSIFQ